jgi:hypothetical protein
MRIVVILSILVGIAHAAPSPGPLSKSHETIPCADCHDGAAKKCTTCHRENLVLHQGAWSKLACETCHLEHRGAAFDITGWNTLPGGKDHFDHARTPFTLEGKHAATPCEQCHPNKNKAGLQLFRGASSSCVACHPQTHAKKFTTDEECRGCHQPKKIDHSATKFPLGAAHARVDCAKCHSPNTTPPTACEACHAKDSPHGTRFDKTSCVDCHPNTRGSFRAPVFDHANRTRFRLAFQHARLACVDCHTGPKFAKLTHLVTSLGVDCLGCHDVHDRKYTNNQCTNCHMQPSGGPPAPNYQFVHGTSGTFPLANGHREIACADCHKNGSGFTKLSPQCGSCHRDPHQGRRPDCAKCHPPGAPWR